MSARRDFKMRLGTPIRAAALAAGLASALVAALSHRGAVAAELSGEPQTVAVAASDFGSRSVALGLGKSVVIDFPRDIKDVLVANPKIANAVIRSSRRAYVIGNEVGQTNIFFFDAEGKQLAGLDIAVTRDLNGIRAAIKQVLPDSDVRVEGVGTQGVILSGFVSSQAEAQQAFDIATRLLNVSSSEAVNSGSRVVNAIVVRNRDQIMLKVTVAEVERDLIKHQSGRCEQWHRPGFQFRQHGRRDQQHQSVHRVRSIAQWVVAHGDISLDHRHVAGDGAGRCHSYPRRANADGRFRRDR
jgi:pilus assembly protein CpaC